MSDEKLRELERQFRETGSADDEVAWLRERARSGENLDWDTYSRLHELDVEAAADYLREHHQAPRLLVGHSLGGAAVLAAAGRIDEVDAVATIAAPAEPVHVLSHFTDDLKRIERDGEAEVLVAGRPFKLKKQFVDDLEGFNSDEIEKIMRTNGLELAQRAV